MGGDGVGSAFGCCRENRLTSVCVSSAILAAGYFLLLAQKKVTKENGTLGAAPLAARAVRYGRTGSAKRPSMASRPNRRDPSRRPRAGHAAGPSALRRGFRGDPEEQRRWVPASAGTTKPGSPRLCFCGRDCRALLFPGPSRPRRAGAGNCRVHRTRSRAGCARVRCQYRDVLSADPAACSRSHAGMDARVTAAARVPFSLVTFFWASKRK